MIRFAATDSFLVAYEALLPMILVEGVFNDLKPFEIISEARLVFQEFNCRFTIVSSPICPNELGIISIFVIFANVPHDKESLQRFISVHAYSAASM
jgi:hypothetical protein